MINRFIAGKTPKEIAKEEIEEETGYKVHLKLNSFRFSNLKLILILF